MMDVVEFLNYLLGRESTRELGLELAAVCDIASRRRLSDAIGSR
jgi:hypothetical protein